MSSFLRYVVEQTLQGESERIKAYTIGVDALGKASDFDPQTDPSVRVLAKRLRDRLREHYAHHTDASLRIQLVSGSYTPRFVEPGEMDADHRYGDLAHPADERRSGFRVEGRPIGTPSGAARHRDDPGPGRDGAVLYLISAGNGDRRAQDVTFLLSGMLSRVHGTDARRVERAPASLGRHDRSLSVHATRLGEELRVDLQVCHGNSGEIVSADVLCLHPSDDGSLVRDDLERLETWVSGYTPPIPVGRACAASPASVQAPTSGVAPAVAPAMAREPLAGWLAGGRAVRAGTERDEPVTGSGPSRPGQGIAQAAERPPHR